MAPQRAAAPIGAPSLKGAVARVCAEELGDDIACVLGEHIETISRLSPALLQVPNGESEFRALLRHLRTFAADRSQQLYSLQERIQSASRRAYDDFGHHSAAEGHARHHDDLRCSIEAQTDIEATRLRREISEHWQAVANHRAAWAAERAELLCRIDHESKRGAAEGIAEQVQFQDVQSAWRSERNAWQKSLDAQSIPIKAREAEVAKRNSETAWVWELIAEQKTAIHGLKLMLQCSEEKNAHNRQLAERRYQERIVARLEEMDRISQDAHALRLSSDPEHS